VLKLGRPSLGHPSNERQLEYYAAYYDPRRAVLPYEFVVHTYSTLVFSVYEHRYLNMRHPYRVGELYGPRYFAQTVRRTSSRLNLIQQDDSSQYTP
jgi:hypothetical protein